MLEGVYICASNDDHIFKSYLLSHFDDILTRGFIIQCV